MTTSFAPLRIRQILAGHFDGISRPTEFGPDGWYFVSENPKRSIIISAYAEDDGTEWAHASVAAIDSLPTYSDLVALHEAVWGEGYAYQCFVPAEQHVNIHENALHLWGRLDGKPVLPEFGTEGSI